MLAVGLKATWCTRPRCPWSVAISRPVTPSQRRAVWSREAEASRVPSGLKATEPTSFRWPRSTAISSPVATSQRRAELSGYSPPEARRFPSGLKASARMSWYGRAGRAPRRRPPRPRGGWRDPPWSRRGAGRPGRRQRPLNVVPESAGQVGALAPGRDVPQLDGVVLHAHEKAAVRAE